VAAVPSTNPFRVPMAVFFIAVIAWGNLRGVKESGRLFAAPTYLFILMVMALIIIGFIKMATGSLHQESYTAYQAGWHSLNQAGGYLPLAVVPLFLAMHALASGSTAMTGVEAISNGVPAFRPPEWLNARKTLMWMGATLGTMFLGISYFTHKLQVVPDPTERSTILADLGHAMYGRGTVGNVAFYVLQVATALILILAANTAFADFPRLANFHAGDNFLPRQFTNRGHRLVFSNGIIALAVVSGFMVTVFGADVTRLIPFYAIGVFTSFSLSQAGMARRHLRLREPGWKHGLVINVAGSIATLVILIVISVTKFLHGAWMVMVLVPIMVWLLVRMNHQYDREQDDLAEALEKFTFQQEPIRPVIVLLVDDVDAPTIHAIQYAKTIRAEHVYALHLEDDPLKTVELETAWSAAGLDSIPLKVVRGGGDDADRLSGFVAALPKGQEVNLVIPVSHEFSATERLSAARAGAKLSRALLPYEQVRVTLVRDHPEGVHPLQHDEQGRPIVRFAPRGRHVVLVLVDKLDVAVLRAVKYSMNLGATEIWAVHAATDPDKAADLSRAWMERQVPVGLDIIECWDRNVARVLEAYALTVAKRGTEVTVVLPRRDFPRLIQRMLHDRTSGRILKALGRYPHIDVTSAPYFFAKRVRKPQDASVVPAGRDVK
jgi:amino acid transporter